MQTLFSARTDYKASLIGWGAYMGYLAIYCLLYTGIVESAPIDLVESFVWVLREWGIWLVLTPAIVAVLRKLHAGTLQRSLGFYARVYPCLAVAALATALVYRVGIDVYGGADLAASGVYFFPKYAAALALVVLAWHLLRKAEQAVANTPAAPVHHQAQGVMETLLVCKGQHERLIRVDQIDVISAAGNYVDIRCEEDVYLLRSSLKQLEDSLPTHTFVRVHRSHLVNVNSLVHITKTAAGNGSVVVRGGHVVPISKKYRSVLKASCTTHATGS